MGKRPPSSMYIEMFTVNGKGYYAIQSLRQSFKNAFSTFLSAITLPVGSVTSLETLYDD